MPDAITPPLFLSQSNLPNRRRLRLLTSLPIYSAVSRRCHLPPATRTCSLRQLTLHQLPMALRQLVTTQGKTFSRYRQITPICSVACRAVTIVTIIVTIAIVIYYRDNDSHTIRIAQLPLKNHKQLLEKQTILQ